MFKYIYIYLFIFIYIYTYLDFPSPLKTAFYPIAFVRLPLFGAIWRVLTIWPWAVNSTMVDWLVVEPLSENMKVSWDDEIPNIWKNNEKYIMFQTTNRNHKWWMFNCHVWLSEDRTYRNEHPGGLSPGVGRIPRVDGFRSKIWLKNSGLAFN